MPPAFIYFDLGQVLCYFDRQREMRQVAEVSGAPEAKITDVLIGPQGLLWRYETGELTDAQFYDEFCRATDTRPEAAAFHKANSEIFTLNDSLIPVIGHLEDAGIPMGILSNTCASHWKVVSDDRFSLIPTAFKRIVLSYETKSLKPDAKIYQHAIQLAGVPANQIFYVDDVPGHVEGARKAGIDAVQYTSTDALIQELRKRGVRSNV